MGRRRRQLISTAVVVVAVGFLSWAVVLATRTRQPDSTSLAPAASATLHTGSAVPEQYVLSRLIGGGSASIASLIGHRPAVLNFFASWCPQCAAELGSFATVSKEDAGTVAFVGIDTGDQDRAAARSLVRGAGDTYPVVVDDSNYSVAGAYGIARLPVTFFVSRDGRVTHEILGKVTTKQLRAYAAELVSLKG